jgi:toxin ParE1/3/4
VQERMQSLIELLMQHPYIGAPTTRPGIRRLVMSPYPYLVFYGPTGDEVVIHAVRHAARKLL